METEINKAEFIFEKLLQIQSTRDCLNLSFFYQVTDQDVFITVIDEYLTVTRHFRAKRDYFLSYSWQSYTAENLFSFLVTPKKRGAYCPFLVALEK